jgi:hypothetical protein
MASASGKVMPVASSDTSSPYFEGKIMTSFDHAVLKHGAVSSTDREMSRRIEARCMDEVCFRGLLQYEDAGFGS